MIKAALVSLGVLILCTLENIGHYFGICFHGHMAQIAGVIGGLTFGFAMYFRSFHAWLLSLREGKPHKCNPENHGKETVLQHLRDKILK